MTFTLKTLDHEVISLNDEYSFTLKLEVYEDDDEAWEAYKGAYEAEEARVARTVDALASNSSKPLPNMVTS